ncbi:MAG: hypothetical protein DHS20C08_12500 [Rhodomicrobium sp.]|nr:MAG: hypothetical protein DHS20C08_12500 [Rhodomicrobium sp.]
MAGLFKPKLANPNLPTNPNFPIRVRNPHHKVARRFVSGAAWLCASFPLTLAYVKKQGKL